MTGSGSDSPQGDFPRSVTLLGAGKMGGALLEGWLASGLDPAALAVIDPQPSDDVSRQAGSHGYALNPGQPASPEIVVVAIKPQTLDAAASDLSRLVGPGTLLVSVLAGKTVADLARAAGRDGACIRAMPNLPAAIRRGATGAYANAATSAAQRRQAQRLLSSIGTVEWVEDEALIDAVTALSGSGPAYLFHLVECMAEAGEAAGLEREVARRLARATAVGAAALLDQTGEDPARLRENVTSPGGTTAAALDVLGAPDGLGPLMVRAVAAAKRRAAELSG